MRKVLFLSLMLLLLSIAVLSAKEQNRYLNAYLLSYPHTVVKGATAPLNWQGRDWLKAGVMVIGTSAIYLWDEELRDIYQRNRTAETDDIMTGFKQFGEGKYIIPAMGLTLLGGYLSGSGQTLDTGMLCVKSFVLSQAVTQTLKLTTQRQRPSAANGKEFFNSSGYYGKRDSFPSGHATLVWSLAPVLAAQYKEKWVAPTVYTIATLTSFSRLNDNRHWSSDVFVGTVIGYISAKLVLSDTPRLAISPNPELQGISFHYRF